MPPCKGESDVSQQQVFGRCRERCPSHHAMHSCRRDWVYHAAEANCGTTHGHNCSTTPSLAQRFVCPRKNNILQSCRLNSRAAGAVDWAGCRLVSPFPTREGGEMDELVSCNLDRDQLTRSTRCGWGFHPGTPPQCHCQSAGRLSC